MLHEFSNIDKPLPKKEGSFLGKFGVGKFQFKKKQFREDCKVLSKTITSTLCTWKTGIVDGSEIR